MRLNILLLLILTPWMPLQAENALDSFEQAVALHRDGQLEEAIEIYMQLADRAYRSDHLYHNLGLALMEDGRVGMARWSYERCIKLHPGSSICAHNLESLKDRIELFHRDFFIARMWNWIDSVVTVFPSGIWAVIALLLSVILALVLNYANRARWKILVGALLLITLMAGMRKACLERQGEYGIIVREGTGLYRGPDEISGSLYEIEEGARTYLLDREGDWLRLRLKNRDEGWVKAASWKRI